MHISKKQLFGVALFAGLTLMTVSSAFAVEEAQADRPKDQAPKTEMTIEQYFVKIDKNADGFLTLGEIKAEQIKAWDAGAVLADGEDKKVGDVYKDGKVTLEELKVAIAKKNQPKPRPTAEQKFKEMDKNADGKIIPAELAKAEMFAAIDTDKNAEITLDELKAFMAKDQQKEKPKDHPKDQPREKEREKEKEKVKDQPRQGDKE